MGYCLCLSLLWIVIVLWGGGKLSIVNIYFKYCCFCQVLKSPWRSNQLLNITFTSAFTLPGHLSLYVLNCLVKYVTVFGKFVLLVVCSYGPAIKF